MHFVPFCASRTVWLHYETRWKTGRTSAKVPATKSRWNFSQPKHPIHPIGPQNISLGSNGVDRVLFWCVSYHLGAFGTVWLLTKLGAIRAELVQKFVPRSRIVIFRNKRTRSTPLDHKLTFCCVWYCLGAFGTVWLPYETRRETGRTSAKVRATKLHRNFSQQTHPIHSIGA